MSASLLRGLRILEMLADEPLGVSELARRLGVDKAGVSRTVAALQREGWVDRTGRRCVLGPRALVLGGVADGAVLARAGEVVHRVGRRVDLTVVALRVAGTGVQPLALHEAVDAGPLREADDAFEHLVCTAAGIALLAQLPDDAVRSHLSLDPWPALGGDGPRGPADAEGLVARVRAGAAAVEHGWTAPGLACVAVPWPDLGPAPGALAVVGPTSRVSLRLDELVRVLSEAVAPAR
ncbi:IclR family transcriptional regulator [Nocardioides flavus (ex Wang et al. 2016)]|uniref:IclR family transcriptional regulator n=1 Tax=Nocardioides flavus (ex Wang et al. 2016) TaxID=2058780 RepID=A0ABQ3HLF2_9ACTN|nr:helix-turn-helix domain-containing protein [Nocardioides flavus (ex Wang et al. 2016)]GHE18508.1 IclR family transcriptional regulator [Nocardioides flavus (ex Wang et al. 2016)]